MMQGLVASLQGEVGARVAGRPCSVERGRRSRERAELRRLTPPNACRQKWAEATGLLVCWSASLPGLPNLPADGN